MNAPLVVIVGRRVEGTKGVRGEPYAAGRKYFDAVARAGGVPLMLPPITSLVDEGDSLVGRVDAVVLHGGGDVDPRRYGEEPTAEELYGVVPEHDEVEFAIVRAALERDRPLLAICRGMQVLNVAMGGTLHQDIGTQAHWFEHHPVTLDPGCRTAAAVGASTVEAGHCVHHQALATIADGLTIVGRTADGIPHVAEVDGARWAVAVQWHPEDSAATDPQQQSLFQALLHAT